LTGAAFAFKRAVRENPDNVNAWIELGEVSDASGSRDEALKSFSRALELQPNNLRARKGQRAVYLKTGDFEAARTELSQALIASPKDSMALYGRGVANFGLGEFPSAAEDFAAAAGSRGAPLVFSFWTHVARGRTDPGDKSAITAACGGTQMVAWERHFCDLFLDKASPAEVESYLNSLDEQKEKKERVMGNFFLAEHAMQRSEPIEAERLYVTALVEQGFQVTGEESFIASALNRLVEENVKTGAVGSAGTKPASGPRKPAASPPRSRARRPSGS
jgi:lipoprotein NlpI